MPHYLHPPVRQLLETHLPDVKEALLRADCVTFDVLATMPPSVTDRTPREGDERFITITGRRPTSTLSRVSPRGYFPSVTASLLSVC
jgi:hypothetical protein